MSDQFVYILVMGLAALVPREQTLDILLVDAKAPPAATDGCPIHEHTPKAVFLTSSGGCVSTGYLSCSKTTFLPPVTVSLCQCVLAGHSVSFESHSTSVPLTRDEMRERLEPFPFMRRVLPFTRRIPRGAHTLAAGYEELLAGRLNAPVVTLKPFSFDGLIDSCSFFPLAAGDGIMPRPSNVLAAEAFVAKVPTRDNTKLKIGLSNFDLAFPGVLLINEAPDHKQLGRCGDSVSTGRHFELYYDLAGWPPGRHFGKFVPQECQKRASAIPSSMNAQFTAGVQALGLDAQIVTVLKGILSASSRPICTMSVFDQ